MQKVSMAWKPEIDGLAILNAATPGMMVSLEDSVSAASRRENHGEHKQNEPGRSD